MPKRSWGTGELVPPSTPGGAWAIRWRENGRRRFRGGFPTRDKAQRALDKIRGDLAQHRAGLPVDPRGFPALAVLAEEWLSRRDHTHRDARHDRGRWRNHLGPAFDRLRASEVDQGRIRGFVEDRLRAGLDPATVQLLVRQLSTMFSDLCERPRETGVTVNPVRGLPRATRRLFKPRHDPRLVPYLERLADLGRVFRLMPSPERYAFIIGALAGLRTSEILALHWEQIDLDARRMVVRWQVKDGQLAVLKDDEPRIVPLSLSLLPALAEYRLASGGRSLLFPPARPGRLSGAARKPARFMRSNRLHAALDDALAAAGLEREGLRWYQATRHTYASQYVLAGGSLESLAALLGHSSTEVTKRYAHLRPEALAQADVDRLAVDLTPGAVAPANFGQRMASLERQADPAKSRKPLGQLTTGPWRNW